MFGRIGAQYESLKIFYANPIVRRVLRGGRVVVVSYALYQAGYNAGLVKYAQNPKKAEMGILHGIVESTGGKAVLAEDHELTIRTNKVGRRIVAAAESYCNSEIKRLEKRGKEVEQRLLHGDIATSSIKSIGGTTIPIAAPPTPNPIKDALKVEFLSIPVEIEFWKNVKLKLTNNTGSSGGFHQWQYLVTNSPHVNAFVTDLLPRRIFVNEGFYQKIQPTDDELALVLGHEIAHLMLGHVPDGIAFDAWVNGIQLFLFSMVDATGLTSFLFDYMVGKISHMVLAARSRECELEADVLGLKIAARACYNVNNGMSVMSKLMLMPQLYKPWEDIAIANTGSSISSQVLKEEDPPPSATAVSNLISTSSHSCLMHVHPPSSSSTSTSITPSSIKHYSWTDTHPPFESRLEALEASLKEYNATNTDHHCEDVHRSLLQIGLDYVDYIEDRILHMHPTVDGGVDHKVTTKEEDPMIGRDLHGVIINEVDV